MLLSTWPIVCILGVTGAVSWGAHEYINAYKPRAEAKVEHEQLQEKIQISEVRSQFLLDQQYEALVARITRLKDVRKRRPLTEDEKADLEYMEQLLKTTKKMRQGK